MSPMRLLLCLLIAAVALVAQDPAAGGGKKKGPPQPHKNLKLLKDEEVGPAMGAFRAALGVQCTQCHVQGAAGSRPDFASDDNPKKEIARHMIEMTREINAKFPDGKQHVSCFTCHRGAVTPVMEPPPAAPPAN